MMVLSDLGSNLLQSFRRSRERRGDAPLFLAKRENAWRAWSYAEVDRQSALLARFLAASGVAPGDRVLLFAENRPEWGIADLAIMRAGAVTVPAYTTHRPADLVYLLDHSGAKAAVVSTPQLLARLHAALDEVRGVQMVICVDPCDHDAPGHVRQVGWDEALAAGAAAPEVDFTDRAGPDDLACFIYTSGTSGRPKGVMLSHGNILANVGGAIRLLERAGLGEEVFLSFLPLSHAYEHTAGLHFPIAIGARVYYAEGMEHLARNFAETRPTIVTCVPRLFEVMHQRICREMERRWGLRARLFFRAVELGRKRYEKVPLTLAERIEDRLLERLVRRRVAERFGGRLKAMVSGGAPLPYEVGVFFLALGLPVLQGYGMTEASPVISCNPPDACRIETVGPPLEGVEVRIAEDGEILVRGPNVMKGYYRDPVATAEALEGGWLHTGDVGVLDPDGYLRITDRKKDIIVNSGGDNIAPQKVEGILCLEPEIAQAVVYGDRRPYLVALVVPDPEFLAAFARANGLSCEPQRLVEHPGVREAVQRAVERANRQLSVMERVRRFALLPQPFSIEDGTLTPTLKVRRQTVYERHRELIESLYAHQPAAAG